jgi:hypothetical protein
MERKMKIKQQSKALDPAITKSLQEVADKEDALLMSFIAPEKPVKTSPVDIDYVTITPQDIYNIEEKIETLQERRQLPVKLHLIIHTPGGSVYATTKIANYLRDSFGEIEAYVPYEAASGGTMLCLGANCIVMDKLSNLTPIDPQTRYKGEWVSASSFDQAIRELQEQFGTYLPEQIPSPYQQMCNKLDPIILKEKNKLVIDNVVVAWELLQKSQIKPGEAGKTLTAEEKVKKDFQIQKLLNIAQALGRTFWPHGHIIGLNEARELGLNISDNLEKLKLLNIYKKWVSERLDEAQSSHIIDYFMPLEVKKVKELKPNKNGVEKNAQTAQEAK